MNLISLKNKRETISILNIIKIIILIIVSFSLIANFYPYYEGWDSFVYGISAINLTQGTFEITNELLQETGNNDFVPNHWTKTIHNTAVPIASPAILGLAAFSYLIGGYYGLFYVGPIFSIIFLIASERVATKLFGGFVGLFTLVLLSTDLIFLSTGVQLLTDNIFSLFFILGCFFLIKFFQKEKTQLVFLSTVFFVAAAFFRFNGIIFFPIEIVIIAGYFGIKFLKNSKISDNNFQNKVSVLKRKNLLKITVSIFVPWIIFFIFWFSFNDYYFGDPLTTYYSAWSEQPEISTIFIIDSSIIESVKFYSAELTPDILNSFFQMFNPENLQQSKDFQSAFAFLIFVGALLISLITKNKRSDVIVLLAFAVGLLAFFSSDYATSIGNSERFMIPNLSISVMLLGFIIHTFWKKNIQEKLKNHSKKFSIIIKSLIIIVLLVLPPIALIESVKNTSEDVLLYESKGIQRAKSGFNFNNPQDFVKRFPLDMEGLTKNSVIVASEGRRIVEYNVIPISTYSGGTFPIDGIFNPNGVPQQPIDTIIQLIKDGYDVYAFKNHWWEIDPQYFRYIEKNYGLILKDYSETFCKMELQDSKNGDKIFSQSDDICYVYQESVIPKN